MAKFKRFIASMLAAASLFGTMGAGVVEPFTFDEVTGDETIVTSGDSSEDEAVETSYEQLQETETETEAETEASEETTENKDLTTLEFHGDSYTVTAVYGPETGIPSDCELQVSEIFEGETYDEYMNLTSEALENTEIGRVRIFDIAIVNGGIEIEPYEGTAVSMKIMLEETFNNEVYVVQIMDKLIVSEELYF